jgi:hypothetical protein
LSHPLVIAVSPYHLATREPAAMAALVLATRVVTLLPHPHAGVSRQAVFAAIEHSPRYLRLLESWRWSSPLWRAGVVSAEIGGEPAGSDLDQVYHDIRADHALADLRPLTREAEVLRSDNAARFLDHMSADLLKGGPDPGYSIPLNAALERFSARHRLILARGAVSSMAQRAEARLGSKVFSLGLPMLVRAGAERLLALREDLEDVLRPLRRAIADLLSDEPPAAAADRLTAAAAAYTREFAAWADAGFASGDDESGKRVVAGYIGLTAMLMPPDAVLRSSGAAMRSLAGTAARARMPAPFTTTQEPARFTLIIREMNVRPESSAPEAP